MVIILSWYEFLFGSVIWQEMHRKAWDMVGNYIATNSQFFCGRASEAESTVLPALTGWIHDTLSDIPETLMKHFLLFLIGWAPHYFSPAKTFHSAIIPTVGWHRSIIIQ